MNRKLISNGKRIMSKLLLMVLFLGCGLASCTYYTNEFKEVDIPDDLSFDGDIVPIFEERCNNPGCHSGAIPPDLQRDVAYDNIMSGGYVTDISAAENNSFYQKIDGGSMDAFATDQDRAYIKKWIEDGAQNN